MILTYQVCSALIHINKIMTQFKLYCANAVDTYTFSCKGKKLCPYTARIISIKAGKSVLQMRIIFRWWAGAWLTLLQCAPTLWESVNSGLDYWNGLLDWTTGLTFDLKFGYEMGDFCMSRVQDQ